MRLKIKTEPRGPWDIFEIDRPMTIEKIIDRYIKERNYKPEYRYLVANVNNTARDLNRLIKEECSIEFLDMRSQAANLTYQRSLSFIYLKAVEDVLGPVGVVIMASLNKGLFTEIDVSHELTEEQVRAVSDRMQELIDQDIRITKEVVAREKVEKWFKREKMTEKMRLLNGQKNIERVMFYSMDGYKNFFYGTMVPSTGYIEKYQLLKYRSGALLRYPSQSSPDKLSPYIEQTMLYYAFGEAKRMNALMGVSYVEDLNDMIRNGEYKELIMLSEALHEKKIADIADMITKQHKRIILIAGPSSSGKTTFARRLCVQLRVNGLRPLYMGTDDYFVDRDKTPIDKNGEPDYEGLDAIDIELFNNNMNDLLAGKLVDIPEFDFMTGQKKFGKRKITIESNQPIVIEGIHGLNGKLTEQISDSEKFKIYVSPFTQLAIDNNNRVPTSDARMLRRMVRDCKYRGHSPESTIDDWPKVREGEEQNIFSFIDESNVVFNSVHVYELAVLKKYAEPLLRGVERGKPEHLEADRMLRFLEFVETIEDDSMIINNSILREFIGGSIFTEVELDRLTRA